MTAAESEYEPVSDYEFEAAVSDYEARSEFDDTDDWEKDKSISKRSARVGFYIILYCYYKGCCCLYNLTVIVSSCSSKPGFHIMIW